MVMATHPRVVAGGRTICTRSPDGSDADSNGADSSIRWRVTLAMSFARRLHQSKSANGSSSRRQPAAVSIKISRGRLMHSSVTSGVQSRGRKARSVRSSTDSSLPADAVPGGSTREKPSTAGGGHMQLIHRPEIEIARDQHLDAIAITLDDRGRDIHGALQHFSHDVLGRGRRVDDRAAGVIRSLYARLDRSVDYGDEHGGAEPLPEVALDLPGQAGSSELVRSWGVEWDHDPGRRARFGPHYEDTRLTLLYLTACFAYEFAATLEQHHVAVCTESIRRGNTGRHAWQGRIDRGLERAVYECSLG